MTKSDIMRKSEIMKLEDVRLSYPSLFTTKVWPEYPDNEPAYEATFILDKVKHAKEIKLINAKIDELLIANDLTRNKIHPQHICMKDGDMDIKEREEYKNSYILSTKTHIRPQVLNRDLSPITAEDDIVYGGCYVNTCFRLGFYKKKAKGVNANLKSIQFSRKGEAFGEEPHVPENFYTNLDGSEAQKYFD